MTWSGRFRPSLTDAEVWPRPAAAADPRLARQRDQPRVGGPRRAVGRPAVLGQRHQPRSSRTPSWSGTTARRWAHHGHDPAAALVGAGTAGFHVGRTSQEALETYRPIFEGRLAMQTRLGLEPVFRTLDDFVERSSALIGSPAQVVDKVLRYHKRVRAPGHAPARRPRRTHHPAAPGRARAVPVRRRARAAPRDPRSAVARLKGPLMPEVPVVRPRPRPDQLRRVRRRRRPQHRRSRAAGRDVSATALLVRRAPPQPRRRRRVARRPHRPGRRRPPTASGSGRAPSSSVTTRRWRSSRSSASSSPAPGRSTSGSAAAASSRAQAPYAASAPPPHAAASRERPADPARSLDFAALARSARFAHDRRAAAATRRRDPPTTASRSTTSSPCCRGTYRSAERRRSARRSR